MKPSGAHTHPPDGSGLLAVVIGVTAAILIAVNARPLLDAADFIAKVIILTVAIVLGLAVLGVVAAIAWRIHESRRPLPPPPPVHARSERAVPPRQQQALPPVVHHHHGPNLVLPNVNAEDLAKLLRQED